jgi:hypothetical protein
LFSIASAQLKADGITDDTKALQAMLNAGQILPEGKSIRITSSVIMGSNFINYENSFKENPLCDLSKYHDAQYSVDYPIEGKRTLIWLDNPDTTMPLIIYTAQGLNKNSNGGLIKNVTLAGNGIGILSAYTKDLKIENVTFIGFKTGLVINNTSQLHASNLNFKNCKRAEYDMQCNNSLFQNISISVCTKGFEVHSNNTSINSYQASICEIGLHIAGGNNLIQNCHIETGERYNQDAQLIVGDTTKERVDGNVFTQLTVTAPNKTGIRFERNCGMVTFTGGGAESCKFDVRGKPSLKLDNFLGSQNFSKEVLR